MNLFSFAQQQLKRESWSRKPTKFESSNQQSKEAQARGNACDERIDNVMEGEGVLTNSTNHSFELLYLVRFYVCM